VSEIKKTTVVERDCFIVRDFTHNLYAKAPEDGDRGFGQFVSGSENAHIFHGNLAALKKRCKHVIDRANYRNRSLEILHWVERKTVETITTVETLSEVTQVGQFDDYD